MIHVQFECIPISRQFLIPSTIVRGEHEAVHLNQPSFEDMATFFERMSVFSDALSAPKPM